MRKQRNILIVILLISLTAHLLCGLEGAAQVQAYEYTIQRQAAQLRDKQEQIELLEIILQNREEDASEPFLYEPEYLGEFEITYYTAGPESTGKSPGHPAYGVTASGAIVQEGRTIAADWNVLAPGIKVYIDGIGERIVEDTGGMIVDKCIDVYVERLEDIPAVGRHMADVWIIEGEDS